MTENLTLLPLSELPQTDEPKRAERCNLVDEQLLRIMKARNLSQAEISRMANIPTTTIHEWVTGGVTNPQLAKGIFNLAVALKVTTDWLAYGVGEDPEDVMAFEEAEENKGNDVA